MVKTNNPKTNVVLITLSVYCKLHKLHTTIRLTLALMIIKMRVIWHLQ